MTRLSTTPLWHQCLNHYQELEAIPIRDLFKQHPQRAQQLTYYLDDILVDFSRQRITPQTIQLLLQLAESCSLEPKIRSLFRGDAVNGSEQRPALHMLLRSFANYPCELDDSLRQMVAWEHQRLADFVRRVRTGEWRGYQNDVITDVVNIGVGGSALGPLMATHALSPYAEGIRVHYISNMDGEEISALLNQIRPASTLFIVASKSFTTIDTLTNAQILKHWFNSQADQPGAFAKHFIGVSTDRERMHAFGLPETNQFHIWEWVGGRYSIWSSMGLALALYVGMEHFQAFLSGGAAVDRHFYSTELANNIPVLMGLINVWNRNFLKAHTKVVLPYNHYLKYLPMYLQQLEMESCGKSITQDDQLVDYATGGVIWGNVGPIGQHSFFQFLHQGTICVPADFIAPVNTINAYQDSQDLSLANAIAQAQTLMLGTGNAAYPGNKPSTFFMFPKITPYILGQLTALYEHAVFVKSAIWNINPFDQAGVELGKTIALEIKNLLSQSRELTAHADHSIQHLLDFCYKHKA